MSNRIVAPATGDGDASSTTIGADRDVSELAVDGDDDRDVGGGVTMRPVGVVERVDGAGVEQPIDQDRRFDRLAPLDPLDDSDAAGGEPEQLQR